MTQRKQTILITGCAGLFGSHLCKYFLDKGYKVVGVDNLQGGYEEFVPKDVEFFKFDLRQKPETTWLFSSVKPDYVLHTAAFAAVCLSPFTKHECYHNNMCSFANVVNGCVNNNVKKLIHFSSMDVYGNANPPFSEDQVPQPADSYGITKYAMEMDLYSTWEQFGLNYSVIRPHNVFGIQQNIWDLYRNVLGIWIRKCLNNENITVYGDGKQERAFSHINFYMEPIEKLMFGDFPTEIFNIGADNPITILDAAKIVQKVALKKGHKSDIIHLEPRNEVKIAFPNHDKAKELLDFKDNTDLEVLIEEMFDWAAGQPNREVKKVRYEITKDLYSYWK